MFLLELIQNFTGVYFICPLDVCMAAILFVLNSKQQSNSGSQTKRCLIIFQELPPVDPEELWRPGYTIHRHACSASEPMLFKERTALTTAPFTSVHCWHGNSNWELYKNAFIFFFPSVFLYPTLCFIA